MRILTAIFAVGLLCAAVAGCHEKQASTTPNAASSPDGGQSAQPMYPPAQ
jgi:hypothetical protein